MKADRPLPVRILHQVGGRVRLAVPGLYRSRAVADRLKRSLIRSTGIVDVSPSPLTGNLVVLFEKPCSVASVISLVEAVLRKLDAPAAGEASWGLESPSESLPVERGEAVLDRERAAMEEKVRQCLNDSPCLWHVLEPGPAARSLGASLESGITEETARIRRLQFGPNALPGTAARSFLGVVKAQVFSLPILLVGSAASLSMVAGKIAGGLAALGVALVNAAVGSITEYRAERSLRPVRASVRLQASVLREGKLRSVSFDELVPGDVIELEAGSRVPADARLIWVNGLTVDESALTGESIPVVKFASTLQTADDHPLFQTQMTNMVYRGTLVVEGSGRALVVAVGEKTVLGRLQGFLGEVFPPEALVARDMRKVARHLMVMGFGTSILCLGLCLLRGFGLLTAVRESLFLLAGALPSGLSTLAVSAFALGHREISRRRVLVRRLGALGSLASIQVVCFDKTGTLTHNRMTVTELHVGSRHVWVEETEFFGADSRLDPRVDRDLGWLITLGALCNEAALVEAGGRRSIEGSSTEKSIIRLACDAGFDPLEWRSRYPLIDIAHRTEERHFMVTTHRWAEGSVLLVVKGSPMEVLDRCSHVFREGAIVPLEEDERRQIEMENGRMAGGGLRVLGAACCWQEGDAVPANLDHDPGLVWAGLFGLEDPLREEAQPLIESLHRAGIKTSVITGDQSLTAYYIGDKLGLSGDEPLSILDTTDLSRLGAAGLRSVVTRAHVFARLNPTQKLQVIQAYQSVGLRVMMVGDGFNDVLALKVAEVGVAMGREGADLARESADLVLEDDNLGTVMAAIAQGRSFYGNLRRSVRYLLTTGQTDLLLELPARSGYLAQGNGLGHAFWTNLLCLSLAHEPLPNDADVALLPGVQEGLLQGREVEDALWDSAGILACAGAAGGYGMLSGGSGGATDLFLRSAAVNQHLFARSCRRGPGDGDGSDPSGHPLNLIVAAAVAAQLAAHLFPGIGLSLRRLSSAVADTAVLILVGLSSRSLLSAMENRRKP